MEHSQADQKTDERKGQEVRGVFNSIARRYDLANHVLSFGMDFYWWHRAVRLAKPAPGQSLLDMCCGTGDLAFNFARFQPGLQSIAGCDFSEQMLNIAKQKQASLSIRDRAISGVDFQWVRSDCTATSFDDASFDIVSCSFGIRNVADRDRFLQEVRRLLKPAGKVCILEFSLPRSLLIRWGYLFYFRYILPFLGGIISGDLKAYRYLVGSVRNWDRQVNLKNELAGAGFANITETRLTFGIATVHIASKE